MALSKSALGWVRRFTLGSVFGGVAAIGALSSCVEAESRFYVKCVGECGCASAGQVVSGTFNLAACGVDENNDPVGFCGYSTLVVVESGIRSSLETEANNNRVETSEIILYAVDVAIESSSADLDGLSAEGLTVNGSIEPEGSLCIDTAFLTNAQANIPVDGAVETLISLKFYGRTTGGLEVETPVQYLPLTVYNDPDDCTCDEPGDDEVAGSNGVPIKCASGCEDM